MSLDALHRALTVYNVGPDEEFPPDSWVGKYDWAVVWYESGSYDGSGEAVVKRSSDGALLALSLGHCSCYGPWDDGFHGRVDINDITAIIDEATLRDSVTCGVMSQVVGKAIELLDQERDSKLRAEGNGGEVRQRSGLQGYDDPPPSETHCGT